VSNPQQNTPKYRNQSTRSNRQRHQSHMYNRRISNITLYIKLIYTKKIQNKNRKTQKHKKPPKHQRLNNTKKIKKKKHSNNTKNPQLYQQPSKNHRPIYRSFYMNLRQSKMKTKHWKLNYKTHNPKKK
jgi:hypothetical protein